jgi:L-ascorbate metabolism protein UlaG (beta-lactamase superfamily)
MLCDLRLSIVLACLVAAAGPAWPSAGFQEGGGAHRITYLANEGVLIQSPSGSVLVDALFGDGLANYFRVEPPLRDRLESARPPFDGRLVVLATHAHGDHFHADAVARYLTANAEAAAILPADARAAIDGAAGANVFRGRVRQALAGGEPYRDHDLGWVRIRALGIPHGQTSRAVDHAAYLITLEGRTLLHIGDTAMAPAEWQALGLPDEPVDFALVPYWYMTNASLADALIATVRPRHIIVLHQPRPDGESAAMREQGGWPGWVSRMRRQYPHVYVPSFPGEEFTIVSPGRGR